MKNLYFLVFALLLNQFLCAQGTIVGTVTDNNGNTITSRVTIYLEKTELGTIANDKGKFFLENIPNAEYTLKIKASYYDSYQVEVKVKDNLVDIGTIALNSTIPARTTLKEFSHSEVFRKSPTNSFTLNTEELETGAGSSDITQALRNVPSLYVSSVGGGMGDSRINIRGFGHRDIGILVNGISLSNPENGEFNWAEWQALRDVSESVEVQRGTGNTPLAHTAAGGFVNFITLNPKTEFGGKVSASIGNDGYKKFLVNLESGLINGWAFSFVGGRTFGDGYVEGAYYDSWTYYGSITKSIGSNHFIQLTALGSPQMHGQRVRPHVLGESFDKYGLRHNMAYGTMKGESFLANESFSHSPFLSLNHKWTINSKSSLSTSVYHTRGTGGYSDIIGGINGSDISKMKDDGTGHYYWDAIVDYNIGKSGAYGQRDPFAYEWKTNLDSPIDSNNINTIYAANAGLNEGIIQYASIYENSRTGLKTEYKHKLTDYFSLSGGLEAYSYTANHYGKAINLLGNEAYLDQNDSGLAHDWVDFNGDLVKSSDEFGKLIEFSEINGELKGDESPSNYIMRNKTHYIKSGSIFSRLDLNTNIGMYAFVSGALSLKHQDIENSFIQENRDDKTNKPGTLLGGNVKAGYLYNLDLNHSIFLNGSFISGQPRFNDYFPLENLYLTNKYLRNEIVLSGELGYAYNLHNIHAGVSGYYTNVMHNPTIFTGYIESSPIPYIGNMPSVSSAHMGIELDFQVKLFRERLLISGMASFGNWKWLNNSELLLRDEDNEVQVPLESYLKGIALGNAARTTSALTVGYAPINGLKIQATYRYFAGLYGDVNPLDRIQKMNDGKQAINLPSFGLADVGASYAISLFNVRGQLKANVYNLFDTSYITEAKDDFKTLDLEYKERLNRMTGWYGQGRTWSVGLSIDF